MSFLGMMEERLPPGFRFHPRDEELVSDYLAHKAAGGGGGCSFPMLIDVDLNKCEPWDLPGSACVGGKEWYFYSLRDRKYATGQRTNRATASGYWKATGKDRPVVDARRGGLVGMRKTLVFYRGRAPKGRKTDWVMHEFRMEGAHSSLLAGGDLSVSSSSSSYSSKEDWVLCRVLYKSRGPPSKHGKENIYGGDGDDGDGDADSSSLPPLMDAFFTFDQHGPLGLESCGQVPCFSGYPPTTHPPYCLPAFGGSWAPPVAEDMQGLAGSCVSSSAREKKAFRTVLDHIGKLDGGGPKTEALPSAAEGSSDSYLTESAALSMWNPAF